MSDMVGKKFGRLLMVDGVEYRSAISACKAAGVSQATFYWRVSRGMTPQEAFDQLRSEK